MNNQGDPSTDNDNEDNLALILHAAQVLEESKQITAEVNTNEAGPSGTVQNEEPEFLQPEYQSLDGSDSDTDTDRDNAILLDATHDLSSHVTSSSSPCGDNRESPKKVTGKRRGRFRTRASIEEMMRRQALASQTHNENERERRKDMRSSVISLRNQLTKPTKRAAVKMVLEAATKELKELEAVEQENAQIVESLKDRQKRLTFELENALKDYEKNKQAIMDGNLPPTPCPPLIARGGTTTYSHPVVTPVQPIAPVPPMVPMQPMTPGLFHPQPISAYPRPLELTSMQPIFNPQLGSRFPLFIPPLPRFVSPPLTSQDQPLISTTSTPFNFGILPNSSLPRVPILPGSPSMSFQPSVLSSLTPFYPGFVPPSISTYSGIRGVPVIQGMTPTVLSPTASLAPSFADRTSPATTTNNSALTRQANEPYRVATIVSPVSHPTRVFSGPTFHRSSLSTTGPKEEDGKSSNERIRPRSNRSIHGHGTSSTRHNSHDNESYKCIDENVQEIAGSKNGQGSVDAVDKPPSNVDTINTVSTEQTSRPTTGAEDTNVLTTTGVKPKHHSNSAGRSCEDPFQSHRLPPNHNPSRGVKRLNQSQSKPPRMNFHLCPPPLSSDKDDEIVQRSTRKAPPLLKYDEVHSESENNIISNRDTRSTSSSSSVYRTNLKVSSAFISNNCNNSELVEATDCTTDHSYRDETKTKSRFPNRATQKRKWKSSNGGTLPTDSDSSDEESQPSEFNPRKRVKEPPRYTSHTSHISNTHDSTRLRQVLRMQSSHSSNNGGVYMPLGTLLDPLLV